MERVPCRPVRARRSRRSTSDRPGVTPPRALPYVAHGRWPSGRRRRSPARSVAASRPSPTTIGRRVRPRSVWPTADGRRVESPTAALVVPRRARRARRAPFARALRRHEARVRPRRPGVPAHRPRGQGGDHGPTCTIPAGLPDGPYPLVLFMHGNHSSCYRGERAGYRWPCRGRDGSRSRTTRGTTTSASRLASYGYVVVSVSAQRRQRARQPRSTTPACASEASCSRSTSICGRRWSTVGGEPFGDRFVGKVDMTTIGTMGHSRGGEGVVWHVIVDRERHDPYGIDAVHAARAGRLHARDRERRAARRDAALLRRRRVRPAGRALLRRRPVPRGRRSDRPKHTITLFGANHNFFNTVWTPSSGYPGAFDDALRPLRGQAHARGSSAGSAPPTSCRTSDGTWAASTDLDPIWTGAATPGAASTPTRALVSLPRARPAGRRLDVDRFTDAALDRATELGDAVTATGLSLLGVVRRTRSRVPCVPGDLRRSADVHLPGLARGVFGWSDPTASVRFDSRGRRRRPAVRRGAVPRQRQPRVPTRTRHRSTRTCRWSLVDGTGARGRRSPRPTSGQRGAALSLGTPPVLRSRDPAAAALPARDVRRRSISRDVRSDRDPVRPHDGRRDRRGRPQLQRGGVLTAPAHGHRRAAGRPAAAAPSRPCAMPRVVAAAAARLGRGPRAGTPGTRRRRRRVPAPTRARRAARRTGGPA